MNNVSEKILSLVAEYKAGPNCWPELWIAGECLTDEERSQFITLTT